MVSSRDDGDVITLSLLDVKILTALLCAPLNAYELVKQCQADAGDDQKLSYGSMSRSTKRLEIFGLINGTDNTITGRISRTYSIDRLGKDFLTHQISRLKKLVTLAEQHLQ